ncbi:segregation and condensation protein A [Syntrophorhabdus aromaticivorans]|uniref:Segregation and condensation protein A n=1 Tax=Syntrophorhabdus aromaticivorans TaxID=328301 RepID=A0A351U042_9BACT|nr:ScpA family protein [Syntrophorhabdus aromaticivorans]NLW35473.1 segregation/condensation protein A [Syntrophorhabdus aromaticivorans]HBA53323.1 segregation/condensation protein A [Syntrophorhabdus aromaticivorans]
MSLTFPELEVRMECYEGPLAVLLTLIRRNRVSIWDIPLSAITERFLDYVDLVTEMNLKIAEDFIEIASLLIYVKSRMLLPADGDGQEDDPREELVERIIEYERLRHMVSSIDGLPMLHRDVFVRGKTVYREEDDHDLLYLCTVFFEFMKSKEEKYLEIREIRPTLEEKLDALKAILNASGVYVWNMDEDVEQPEKVATVLGILELTKIKVATVIQRRPFGRIIIKRRNGYGALAHDQGWDADRAQ